MSVVELGKATERDEAEAYRLAQMEDYLRIGASYEEARLMAFGANGESPDAMIDAIKNGNRRYFKLETQGAITAIACLADWLYADSEPYESPLGAKATKAKHLLHRMVGYEPTHDSHLPVFGVSAHGTMEVEGSQLLDHMIHEASHKRSKNLYVVADMQDESFVESFRQKGADLVPNSRRSVEVNGVARDYELLKRELQ